MLCEQPIPSSIHVLRPNRSRNERSKLGANLMCTQTMPPRALAGLSPGNLDVSGTLGSMLSTFLNIVGTWIARGMQRRLLAELARDSRLLSDIGLTRAQALREAGKPFWQR